METHPDQISGTVIVFTGHEETINTLDFSPNNRYLASGGADNIVLLWDLFSIHSASGIETISFKSHRSDIYVVMFSPFGHWLVTAGKDKTTRLWDMSALELSEQEPITLKSHRKAVTDAIFTPDRNWLITTSQDDTARLWDMNTEWIGDEKPYVLRGHDATVLSVISSSDSNLIATDSEDNTVRVYDLRTTAPPTNPFFNQNSLRYIIPPLIAFLIVFFAGARYVQDVYLLKTLQLGLRYVFTSMLGVLYPQLVIDNGKPILRKGESNLLKLIGGPGFVILQPGNAAFFKYLRRPTGARINRYVFLGPFETLGPVVNLDDQHGFIDEIFSVTKDGIRVELKDINYRYRVPYRRGARRTLEDPYPFDPDALNRRGANVTINDQGLVSWDFRVRMTVSSTIREYIATHSIDYLTAPREQGRDPRRDFRQHILRNARVGGVGADLLWIDVGHFHKKDDEIDEVRVDYWAADWKGQATVQRALSRAQQQIFMEQGRARAQADMILSITQALQEASITGSTAENIRAVFLSRISQIIENMRGATDGKKKG
jgi:hypothetical protein